MGQKAPLAVGEQRRLEALQEYLAADILSDSVFSRLTGVVARLFAAPIAAISVIDSSRQIVKAAFGWSVREIPRKHSFCARAIASGGVLVIPDARKDPRFRRSPLVVASGLRFYAGVALRTKENLPLGTLSILDYAPRRLDERQQAALRDLAGMVMSELDLRLSMARTIAAAEEDVSGELRYRELFDNANDMVYTHDLQGRFTSVNKATEKLTGYTREEALGMSIYDMATPEAARVIREAIQEQLGGSSRTTHEVEILAKDGRKLILEVSTRMLFRRGIPAAVQGIARDITERKKAEAQLRLLRSVVVNANDAVMVAEAPGGDPFESRIVYVNEAFCRITGYDADAALAVTPRVLLGPNSDPFQVEQIAGAVRRSAPFHAELTCYRKDSSEFWVDMNIVPILDENGAFTYWVVVFREITDRKRAEMLERDRNEVLELVAGNAPLETVLGRLSRLVERQCPGSSCSVMLARNERLYFASTPSLPQAAVESLEGMEAGALDGPAGRPALLEELVAMPPLEESREILLAAGLRACWPVPILSGDGRMLGVIAVFHREPRRPAPAESKVLEMVSRLAAVGIEQRQLNLQLAYQARHDALTGLPNRLQLAERLQQELDKARRNGWMAAVLFIDLDRFKQINDTLGHSVGDALLRQVSQRFGSCIRSQDILARMGGDEFTLVLSELKDLQDALRVAQKLLDSLKAPFHIDAYELFVTASVGISIYPRDGKDAITLQRNADSAMYRAKSHGKNSCRFFTPDLGAAARERLEIETDLRRAVRQGELELFYQPIAELDGRLAGLEALLVWNHPKLGAVPPSQFIPIAEESGLIVPLGSWVLTEACRQNASWQRRGYAAVKVAANVSPMQFARADFVETVAQALAQSGLDPSLLELELTESVVMRDAEESARQMERLRALGVGISIDDFGTGYSSLSYLRRLPIDTLKIDRTFLKELETDDTTLILVHAIIAVAHSLKLTVVAEGVENERQLQALRAAGCDKVQGYLLGEPLPRREIEVLLARPDRLLPLPPVVD